MMQRLGICEFFREDHRHGLVLILCYSLVPLVIFCFFFNLSILNPSFVDWLYERSDAATHQLGFSYFVSSGWNFPIGGNPRYGLDNSLSVFFTDSIPILAIAAKVLIQTDHEYQLYGLLILFNYIASFWISFKIFSYYSDSDFPKVLASALICLIPIGVYRLLPELGHLALSVQSIILLNVLIFGYKYKVSLLSSVIVVIVSLGTHPYFGIMSCVMAFGALFDYYLIRRKNFNLFAIACVLVSVSFFLYLYLVGYFSYPLEPIEKWGYGFFSGSLVDIFDPTGYDLGNQPYLGTSFSRFSIGSLIDRDASWEGFSYLGLGILCLLVLGLIRLIIDLLAEPRSFCLSIGRNLMYITVVCLLFLVSLSHEVRLGGGNIFRLADKIYIDKGVIDVLHNIRSSARFGWPLYYSFAYLCIGKLVSIGKRLRIAHFFLILLLVSALVIQSYDVAGAAKVMRSSFHVGTEKDGLERILVNINGSGRKEVLFLDSALVRSSSSIRLARAAMRSGLSTNIIYAARERSIPDHQSRFDDTFIVATPKTITNKTQELCSKYFKSTNCASTASKAYRFIWLDSKFSLSEKSDDAGPAFAF